MSLQTEFNFYLSSQNSYFFSESWIFKTSLRTHFTKYERLHILFILYTHHDVLKNPSCLSDSVLKVRAYHI